jgi:hypothetical protein
LTKAELEAKAEAYADETLGYTESTRMKSKEWHRVRSAYLTGASMAFEEAAKEIEEGTYLELSDIPLRTFSRDEMFALKKKCRNTWVHAIRAMGREEGE